jgi:phage-related protein
VSENWKIIYYQNQQGKSQAYDFIENLELQNQAKIFNTFNLLEQYGFNLGAPHIKKLKSYNLWELRVLGNKNIRIFFISTVNKEFLLLHAFQKKKQKTDQKEIKTALQRLKLHQTWVENIAKM